MPFGNHLRSVARCSRAHMLAFAAALLLPLFARSAGTWTPVTANAPGSVGLMVLLSDGTVMAQNSGVSSSWYRLTPNSQGHYIAGTWTTVQAMHDSRLYCSTQILRDGRLYMAGGEYGTGRRTGEVYDPLTNTWKMAPLPGHTFSDSNSAILPDGRVLTAYVEGTLKGTTLFDPVANTWTTGPNCIGIHNECAWVKLPDDSILQVDRNTTSSERYIPATNQWVADATVPVVLYDPYGLETGGAVLLPNGQAFFVGSLGHTALYTPSGSTAPGVWTAGPDLPNGTGTPDAPLAILPNGKVLCAVSPIPTSLDHFPSPTTFYEYDYTTNAFTSVPTPTGGTLNHASYFGTMLVLPDGTVLYSDFASKVYSYQHDGVPVAAGKPVIDSITANADGSYHLVGQQLNGISEGSCYGDDNQNATNYPIVWLKNAGGTVYRARTFNWTSTSVATGSAPVATEFTLPAGIPAGTYTLTAIANGISSDGVPFTIAPIVVTLPASAAEGAAPVSGTVTLPSAAVGDVTVSLASGTPSRATVPASVTVPSGQTAATFAITVGNDAVLNGAASVRISATAPDYEAGGANMVITDDESATLTLTPGTSITSSGPAGGPFTPPSFTYTLNNTGTVSLTWSTFKSANWLTISPSSGTIAAGGNTVVTVTINTNANGLPASSTVYTDTVIFNNTTNGSGNTSRPASLTVNGLMTVTPATGLTSTGVYGGAFSPASASYTITAPSSAGINWSAGKTANWITLSPASGSLAAGGTVTVTATINANANTLLPGNYPDTLTFTNTSTGAGNTTRAASLTVTGSPALAVTPAGGLSASGDFGGPFMPASADYLVMNSGTSPLNWTAAKSAAWVSLSSTSGTLAPGASATVTASVNAAANALEPGSYSDTVTFTNVNNGTGNTTRGVGLTVVLPAPALVAEPAVTGGTANTISWSTVGSANAYEAQYATDSGFTAPASSGLVTATGQTFTNLANGVTYYYRVRSHRTAGADSAWSAAVSSRQDATPPALMVGGPASTMSASVTLQGTSSDAIGPVSVLVGGVAAQTTDGFAHWTATVSGLAEGSNAIAVTASDSASPANVTTQQWTVTRLADADGDSLPDSWETAHALTGADRSPTTDTDFDGVANFLEYAFALDPNAADPAGLPVSLLAVKPADGLLHLHLSYRRWIGGGGLRYDVETSTDLVNWNAAGADVEADGAPVANEDGVTETVNLWINPALGPAARKWARLHVHAQ